MSAAVFPALITSRMIVVDIKNLKEEALGGCFVFLQ